MSGNRRSAVLVLSSLALAAAPKCPFCILAFLGVVGTATTAGAAYRVWLFPATVLWLGVTVAALAWRARGARQYGPPVAGAVAAAAILIGKFHVAVPFVVYAGMAVLAAAAVWRAWPRRNACSFPSSDCARE